MEDKERTLRSPRPRTSYFDSEDLADQWKELANLRTCGFSWDGRDYAKPSRSTQADKQGLRLYMNALAILLKMAPTGFPSHADLRNTFMVLDKKHGIFGTTEKAQFRVATEATEIWRVMCKDVYNMAKGEDRKVDAEFKDLVEIITLPESSKKFKAGSSSSLSVDNQTN